MRVFPPQLRSNRSQPGLARTRNGGALDVPDDRVTPSILTKYLLSQLLHLVGRVRIVGDLEVVPGLEHMLQGALVGALGYLAVGVGRSAVGAGGGGGGQDRVCTEDLVDCGFDLANEEVVVGLDEVVACADQTVSGAESAGLIGMSVAETSQISLKTTYHVARENCVGGVYVSEVLYGLYHPCQQALEATC